MGMVKMGNYNIPGIYSTIDETFAHEQSLEQYRRYLMSLQKIIMGPDGNLLKVNTDGTLTVTIAGTDSSGGAVNTNLKSSEIIQPIDIQARLASTIQVVTGQVVAATTGTYASAWVDCDGFGDIAITFMNDAGTNSYVDIRWSHDGSTYQSAEFAIIPSNTAQRKAVSTPIKARYAQIVVANTDAAPHTMNAWAYLKA
jgi:hypothetical protein